ncbi:MULTISPECIES: winged helix-turn-helix transcriptional regulator [Niastella]|uniref:Helix-turn-helix transcriptional regulator n=1 Tax=Niastella soli TaxID=2821487 RepID=A0ABS3Z2R9_9BACT|nr:helix-turn-helix domain-containing protein [Niastella soli]MBO9204458.1 helix-turn-helix transcriptional regulator [Niastella soli]
MKKSSVKFSPSDKCPVRTVLDRLGDKWSVLVILLLGAKGSVRFNHIQKEIGDVSQKMLTITLKSLEADGIVSRHVFAEVPIRVEYRLTERGESLLPHIQQLSDWAEENMRQILKDRKQYVA